MKIVIGSWILLAALAGPAQAQVPPPTGTSALAFGAFTGSGDRSGVPLGVGLSDLLLTDAVAMLNAGGERATCPAVVVEWQRRGDVQKEIEFQQSRFVDPATRVRPGRMIVPTIMVTGNTHFAGDSATYVIEMRNHADGTPIRTIKGTVPASGLFDATKAIARQVLEEVCAAGWIAAGGTTSGGAGVTITGEVGRLEAPFELKGTFMGGQAVFKYLPTGTKGGTVTYTMGGSGVKGSGKGAFTMAALDDGRVRIKQTTTGCVDGIPNSCRTTTEVITLTSKSKKK